MATSIAALQRHLADLPGGVGCRHLARQRDGLSTDLLVTLGLVRPIVSNVPSCAAHDCPLIDTCPHLTDFEPEAKGSKAGVKYRPTPEGLAATANSDLINEAILQLPAARQILDVLAAGPTSRFQLHAAFMTQARQATRGGEAVDNPALSRVTLTAVLDLLIEAGCISCSPEGLRVWLTAAAPPGTDKRRTIDVPSAGVSGSAIQPCQTCSKRRSQLP